MAKGKTKIETEKRTVAAMIALYCRGKGHGVYSDVSASKTLSSKRTTSSSSPFLCPECSELLHYAHQRLERCRFGEEKPSCTRCPVHCYRKDMRERIRQIMRYSGPRMLL
ncbi:MAG: nitrous oxide-stimulated promoter family protein, partial [Bacteroidaceae bacterium]|nr:nitrous oxide-stimulated promoter family protein [Bacteroidaceae bacterium]